MFLFATRQIETSKNEFVMDECLINIVRWLGAECNYLVYASKHQLVTKVMQSQVSVINIFIKDKIDSLVVYGHSYLYTIMANSVADYYDFLKTFELAPTWNPQEPVLIVFLGEIGINEVLKLAHTHLTHRLLILTPSKLMSYFPFKEGSCSFINTTHDVSCTKSSIINTVKTRIPTQFRDCKLRTVAVPFQPYVINVSDSQNPGLDIQITKEIGARLNISIEFLKSNYTSWGGKLNDGTYTLMYGLLAKREADMMIGMTHGNSTVDDSFASTMCYTQDHANFFVPAAVLIDAWRVFALAFDKDVWILLFLSFVVMTLMCWLVADARRGYGYNQLDYCILKVLCTWFSTHSHFPRTSSLRFLLTLWCCASLLVNSSYQGKLMSFLTKPVYEKQISTMQELAESHLLIGGFPTLKSHLVDKENEALAKISGRWIYCELDFSCVTRTAQKRDFAVVKSVRGVNYITPKMYLDSNGRPMLFKFKDTITMYLVRFVAVKGLPFFDRMNTVIARLVDSGIVDKWLSDLQFNNHYEYRDEFRKISLEHLSIVLLVFFCGHLAALAVFILEVNFKNASSQSQITL